MNGILERTDAYTTGSGLDAQSVNGITVIPAGDNLDNKDGLCQVRLFLSSCALKFVNVCLTTLLPTNHRRIYA